MTDNSLNTKIIDIDYGAKLVGNKLDLAKDILAGFIQTLPSYLSKLQAAKATENEKGFLELVHKLHGGLCYCGLPRLKRITEDLEKAALHRKTDLIASLYDKFLNESLSVIEEAKKL